MIDIHKLIGIDRTTDPPSYIKEVVLRGEHLTEFLDYLADTKYGYTLPIINWRRADRAIGFKETPINDADFEIMGHMMGRDWYAIYMPE